MSQLKIKDGANWIPIPAGGVGVPSGGTQGQVLAKTGSADYATGWESLIVESGTSDGWQYWKFADGRVRLRYAATIPGVAITTSAGSVYRASSVKEILYPFLVNDAVANVSVRMDSGTHFPWAGGVVSFQSYVRFMVYNHSSVTSGLITQIEVNGFLPE